ncbi:MAG: DUF1566 domain-containing protein [Lewinellaceae bacterium]|nr:DUF1566 domain-containing protein [Lewinellaceae bacterium]
MKKISLAIGILAFIFSTAFSQTYKIVDTGQTECFNNQGPIPAPLPGAAFYGQDAQHNGNQPAYQDNGDGTVTDLVTGLMWQKNLYPGKYTYVQALAGADTCTVGGYDDWRLPTIKEMYSLILFSGKTGMNAQTSIPFLDTNYFDFRYGFEDTGERFIDAQYITSTEYAGLTMGGAFTAFGVNFADGRIKGYPAGITPMGEKLFEVRYVRGISNYGVNDFVDNQDGTVTDQATGLMWTKADNGEGLNWEEALAWVQAKNAENYLGYDDWRLPNVKELQSIVDYTRSPQTTNSAALDTVFESSTITDEGDMTNYPFCWSSTTHGDGPPDMAYTKAAYVCFGEALGFMEMPPMSGNYFLLDVHGAGAQRSDPKTGDPADYPLGFGPQGDVIRIFNFVRLVRDVDGTTGMRELESEENRVAVFPNPAMDVLNVVFDTDFWENGEVGLYDSAGRVVFSGVVAGRQIALKMDFPAGVYFLRLEKDGVGVTRKIILN